MAGSDYDEGRLGFEFQLLELSRLNVKFYQTLNFLPIAFNNIIIVVVAANIHNPGYGDFFGTFLGHFYHYYHHRRRRRRHTQPGLWRRKRGPGR